MKRFLKHMWQWVRFCPLWRSPHVWTRAISESYYTCLVCGKTEPVVDAPILSVDMQYDLHEDRENIAVDPRLLDDTDTEDFAMSRGGTD